jgi:hypothetical protein
MKHTHLIIIGMMMFLSANAMAEGGAERMRYYFEKLRLNQQQTPSKTTDGKSSELRVPDDQTAQVTESYRPK